MLMNKLVETNRALKNKQNIDEIKRNISDFQNAMNKINSIKKELYDYCESIKNLNRINLEKFPINNLEFIAKKLKMLRADMESDYIDRQLLDEIKREVDKLQNDLKIVWFDEYKQKTTPLINTIVSVKDIIKEEENINIIITALNPNKQYWPVNTSNLNIIDNNLDKGKTILNNLHLNDNIREFINKISEKKATIFDLTPEILKWIKEKGLEDKIGLVFK